MAGEKTEKPTPKKLKDARKKGQPTVAVTPEIGGWTMLLVASFVLPMMLTRGIEHSRELLGLAFGVIENPEPGRALGMIREAADAIFAIVFPLLIVTVIVALVAHAGQGGVRPSGAMLKPQLKRLNPLQGIKRIVGPHAIWEVTKVLHKTAILGAIVWQSASGVLPTLTSGGRLPLGVSLSLVGETVIDLVRNAAAAGVVLSFADYAIVRRRTSKGLKMSKQDIKDEYKQSEGDPAVKAQIRSRQMAMSRNRMMSDVSKADVIIVNPVHVAVALKYEPARGAPRVLAKGAGVIARRIREEAEKSSIPLVENVTLARSLYKACEIGQEIPAEMYAAVAQVLAFVMALKARGSTTSGVLRPPGLADALPG